MSLKTMRARDNKLTKWAVEQQGKDAVNELINSELDHLMEEVSALDLRFDYLVECDKSATPETLIEAMKVLERCISLIATLHL